MASRAAQSTADVETNHELHKRIQLLLAGIDLTDDLSEQVRGACNGARLSGTEPSDFSIKLLVLVERGDITSEQMRDAIRRQYDTE